MKAFDHRSWNPVTAGHFLSRAGFAARPAFVDACLEHQPAFVVDSMLQFVREPLEVAPPYWVGPDAAYRQDPSVEELPSEERGRANRRIQSDRLEGLRHWWCEQMLTSPYGLQEKLVLFWHGHFATSFAKVRNAYAFYRQNALFREHAAGSWRTLLQEITRDPAMMVYLDTSRSRMQNPNENYARELMELFTLGEGNYTEEDIRDAARALTGLRLDEGRFEFVFRPRQHDSGRKLFMGRRGRFGPDEIIDIILSHPESARFITRKLAAYFMGVEPSESLVAALARQLRASGWRFAPVLRSLFLSEAFYAPEVLRSQIKSPVQWLIGTCQLLDRPLPPSPIPEVILRELGQNLFAPPNVKGWEGGFAWISTTTLSRRMAFSDVLIHGASSPQMRRNWRRAGRDFAPADPQSILPESARVSVSESVTHLHRRFFHVPIRERELAMLRETVGSWPADASAWRDADIRNAALACMQIAQFQLT